MAHDEELPSMRRHSKLIPLTLLALGATAVVMPFLLRRNHPRITIKKRRDAPPPPIRRNVVSMPESLPAVRRARTGIGMGEGAPHTIESHKGHELGRKEKPVSHGADAGGPLFALKALGVATCVVTVSAIGIVFAVRWSLGVQNTEEFGTRMRVKLRELAPNLLSRIHRTHTPSDSPLYAIPQSQVAHPYSTDPDSALSPKLGEWMSTEAEERLSRAYEEGGLLRWMEAVEKELEREASLERSRRGYHEDSRS